MSGLPDHWKWAEVGKIAECSLGKMLDRNKNQGTPRPYLRNINVRWFEFDLSDLKEMRFEASEIEKFTAQRGDVMICEGGYPGRAAIWDNDDPIHFQKAVHRVRFHEPECNKWFLYYLHYLEITGQLSEYFTGTGIKHFTGRILKKLTIPLPPLSEQRRIVSVLDAAFAGLATATANTQKNLQNARELLDAKIAATFSRTGMGWAQQSLGDHIDLLSGFAFKSRGYTDSTDSIRLLRGDNIMQGYFRWEKAKRWPMSERDEYKRYELEQGDIVLAMDRTWVQAGVKYAVITEDDLPCLLVQRVARIRPTSIDRRFLAHLLGSHLFSDYVLSIQTGLGVPHISGKQISDFTYQAPSQQEQNAIGNELDELQEGLRLLRNEYGRKLASLEELKQSILHRAFRGELSGDGSTLNTNLMETAGA